ncbi:hypothetical protein IMF23_13575 [Chelatococcus daeguensis]|uniref:Uncharacterized protein n=1 Tax=Chelatococcus sambhunathii TaxID=363953 RepID=A0ABP2AD98_9HYPH|nr:MULTISPECIES: hypothetical protein [Chelatococcus]KZE28180.1 hypothetical protein AVW15_08715 [Chelatococcus daeguensis]MBM3084470.1 hypothetical protein [Chelatococcus daeguensis]CUA90553.1 hypothetical protein Ga0061061_11378 [Chelatococcus sambhunathii]
MTNVFGKPGKIASRRKLFELGQRALEQAGWRIERIQGIGKSSVRRIVRGAERHTVSIRTTQDTWIAFPRNEDDSGWVTLDDVDYVAAVTVDDKDNPKRGLVYMVDGDEMRERFDRAYRARLDAGHSIPIGRGVWVSMFLPEDPETPSSIGGGIALGKQPLLTAKLDGADDGAAAELVVQAPMPHQEAPLTIAEAKRRLAQSLGVDPEKVKIVIEA